MARDPILYQGKQANLYAYINNNSINYRDPTGLFCIGGSAYVGVGAGAEVTYKEGQISYCGELGVGLGGGIGGSLNGDVKSDSAQRVSSLGVDCGSVGISVTGPNNIKDTFSGFFTPSSSRCKGELAEWGFEIHAGIWKYDSTSGFDVGFNNTLTSLKKPKCELGGKIAYQKCVSY